MSAVRSRVRRGAYHDSIVLLRLQAALADLEGVEDAGVVMGTATNLALLAAGGLTVEAPLDAGPDDLVVVVRGESAESAEAALGRLDELLARRAAGGDGEGFRPRSLESAAKALPEASLVAVSVPGRHAAGVARRALALGRHVFLYSDNVPLAEEVALKREARERGLLVLGPDCGTAVLGGVGLGFANRVRRGAVGIVAASGTGLQTVASRVHALGGGISQAVGTGGRDLSAEVGAVTALQGLELLRRDPETRVIVLVSKPPDRAVVARVLAAARATGKPVVAALAGWAPPARRLGGLRFAGDLEDAATLAVELAGAARQEPAEAVAHPSAPSVPADPADPADPSDRRRFLRGLFAGGTLAGEALRGLAPFLEPLSSNLAAPGVGKLADPARSEGHAVVDLGADELTVGRLHPMLDPDLRLRRLAQEAADPEVGLLLLDVVLGDGAHPDPAADLAPAIEAARAAGPEVVVILVGTDEDPQDLARQEEALTRAGAAVYREPSAALARVVERLAPLAAAGGPAPEPFPSPLAVIDVGLESFHESLLAQGARAVHVDWRPPAGGDERLSSILERLRGPG